MNHENELHAYGYTVKPHASEASIKHKFAKNNPSTKQNLPVQLFGDYVQGWSGEWCGVSGCPTKGNPLSQSSFKQLTRSLTSWEAMWIYNDVWNYPLASKWEVLLRIQKANHSFLSMHAGKLVSNAWWAGLQELLILITKKKINNKLCSA